MHWAYRTLGSVVAGAVALALEVCLVVEWQTASGGGDALGVFVALFSIPALLVTTLTFWSLAPRIRRLSFAAILATLAGAAALGFQTYLCAGHGKEEAKCLSAILFALYWLPGAAAVAVFKVCDYPPTPNNGFCPCGYDLTGNTSGVCPECGERIVSEPDSAASACSCSNPQEETEGTESLRN